jgi:uncharacterized protein (DUF2147 family)
MKFQHLAQVVAPIMIGFLTCFSFGADATSGQERGTSAVGLWQQIDSDGTTDGWFLIYENNGVYEGAIAKMFFKPGENPNPICTKCMGEQKNQPSLGLTIIKGMQRNGLKYENGSILDPRDGDIYNAMMELSPDGKTLTVRGYLGIALFGRSQTWQRLPDTAMAQVDPSVIAAHAPALATSGSPARSQGSPARPRAPSGTTRGQAR